MSKSLPPHMLNQQVTIAARDIDKRLREFVGENPTEDAVIAAFPKFFTDSRASEKSVRLYAKSVVAGRPHFV